MKFFNAGGASGAGDARGASGASIFFSVVLQFFFLKFSDFYFEIINFDKNFIENYTFYYIKILCTDSI